MKKFIKFTLVSVLLILSLFVLHSKSFLFPENKAPKNVVLLIGDGMGENHIKAGEYLNGKKFEFCSLPKGYVENLTTFFETTDSAAAGTAIATGTKTDPEKISKDIFNRNRETILELKKSEGKSTGIITTTSITDATPAVFASHNANRHHSEEILNDFAITGPDIIMGGGHPKLTDLKKLYFKKHNFEVINTYDEFKLLKYKDKPIIATFGTDALPYFDEEKTAPSLQEMTEKSLNILSKNKKGFFLMVEGGRIDDASHDLAKERTVNEVKNFGNTADYVLKWAKRNKDTMVIITADHETTGIKDLIDKGKGNVPTFNWKNRGSHTKALVPIYIYNGNCNINKKIIKNISIFKLMK
ncbi:alkaline phosphatase [Fusobacterium sp. MFO224]|uniref:alkaline phosphatase n=1 Tax=Fusobacterium sp. MFO224 TaxID=3378070 RepID=UPI0038538BDA